jgi:hypothetical protein
MKKVKPQRHTPDIFDLTGWILDVCPQLYHATKYLSDGSKQYKLFYDHWVSQGRPNIS